MPKQCTIALDEETHALAQLLATYAGLSTRSVVSLKSTVRTALVALAQDLPESLRRLTPACGGPCAAMTGELSHVGGYCVIPKGGFPSF